MIDPKASDLTIKLPDEKPAIKVPKQALEQPARNAAQNVESPAVPHAASPAIPEWIAKRTDTTTDYAADGTPVKIRVAVCTTCRNTLHACKTYGVCETPVRGMLAIWDSANGENTRAAETIKRNAKAAAAAWKQKQSEQSVRRTEPAADGAAVTPIAPGFEGFAVIATRAAEMGFLVIPITPGQKFPPLLSGFQHKATSDLNQIAQWAQQYPQANAGAMATPDGHIFLDEDNAPRIHELYREKYGEDYPRTYTTESRPGHRQTAWLQTNASRALGNATQGTTKELVMSVRQKNYYVMVAGSIHPDTKEPYRVVDDSPIIPMPDKLVDFIKWLKAERIKEVAAEKAAEKAAKGGAEMATTVDVLVNQSAPAASNANEYNNADNDPPLLGADRVYGSGERNNILSRYAYRRWVMELADEDELREDVHDFNEQHIHPPLSDSEVNKLIAAKLSLKQIGTGVIRDGELVPTQKLTVESLAADAAIIAAYAAKQPLEGETVEEQMEELEERQTKNPDAPTLAVNFKLLLEKRELAKRKPSWIESYVQTASQISDEPVRWVLHELLLHESVNILCAEHGSMKSILSLLMVKAILTNTSFAHRAPFGEPLRVVYVDAENPRAVVKERLKAIGLVDADGKEIPGFKIWGGWVTDENLSVPSLMDDERLIEDAIRYPNTFYIFDALSSFTNGEDENKNPEMAVHMRRAKRLSRMSAGVLILHHTPKSGKADWRGAMSIIDQSDHALMMERAKGNGNFVDISDIRFRACEPWEARLRVIFDQVHPDGRTGLYIHYNTIDSGVKGDKSPRDDSAAAVTPDEVNFERSDDEIRTQAAALIAENSAAGREPLNQTQLANMCGISNQRQKTHLFSKTGSEKYWQCVSGPRSSLLYYPPGETIPSVKEMAESKAARQRAKDRERKSKKAGGTRDAQAVTVGHSSGNGNS